MNVNGSLDTVVNSNESSDFVMVANGSLESDANDNKSSTSSWTLSKSISPLFDH